MGKIQKSYNAAFKAEVALEAVKKEKTIAQLSSFWGFIDEYDSMSLHSLIRPGHSAFLLQIANVATGCDPLQISAKTLTYGIGG